VDISMDIMLARPLIKLTTLNMFCLSLFDFCQFYF